jgi:hypothetical protein
MLTAYFFALSLKTGQGFSATSTELAQNFKAVHAKAIFI